MLAKYPIIQAPMAGPAANARLVAVVSNAGALGSLGAAYMAPEKIREEIDRIRKLTDKPYLVNLFVPQENVTPAKEEIDAMVRFTNRFRRDLGIPELDGFEASVIDFEKQFEVVLEMSVPVFSFVFGLLSKDHISECRKRNIFVIGTATTLEEALALQETGVDAICAQGFEAGGHRGIFNPDYDAELTLDELLDELAGELKIPVIAAGGLMSGMDINRVLKKGAIAAQLGTAFLACEEAGIATAYRRALLQGKTETVITTTFSGRPARGIFNRFIEESKSRTPLPFVWQNQLTRDIRMVSLQNDNPDYYSLWAGINYPEIRVIKVADLVETLVQEMA